MNAEIIRQELKFKAVRSSGPGGQHVNKVSTKIEAQFDINKSEGLTEDEKERIQKKLKSKISKDSILIVTSQDSRSQLKNKKEAAAKLLKVIENALKRKKKRKPTKPSKASKEKRLKAKKRKSEIKATRTKPKDF